MDHDRGLALVSLSVFGRNISKMVSFGLQGAESGRPGNLLSSGCHEASLDLNVGPVPRSGALNIEPGLEQTAIFLEREFLSLLA